MGPKNFVDEKVKIISFTEASVNDCNDKLNIRKVCLLKYRNIILWKTVDNVSDYIYKRLQTTYTI